MVCLLIEVLPRLSCRGRVDVYIKKKGGGLWQCKELMLKELYADLTIRFMSRLCRKQLNPIIDLELLRKNKFIEKPRSNCWKSSGRSQASEVLFLVPACCAHYYGEEPLRTRGYFSSGCNVCCVKLIEAGFLESSH